MGMRNSVFFLMLFCVITISNPLESFASKYCDPLESFKPVRLPVEKIDYMRLIIVGPSAPFGVPFHGAMDVSGQRHKLSQQIRRINKNSTKKLIGAGIDFFNNYSPIRRDLELKSKLLYTPSVQAAAKKENAETLKRNASKARAGRTRALFLLLNDDSCEFLDQTRKLIFEIDQYSTIGVYEVAEGCTVMVRRSDDEMLSMASVMNVGNTEQIASLIKQDQLVDIFFECVFDIFSFMAGEDYTEEDAQGDRIEEIRRLLIELMKQ